MHRSCLVRQQLAGFVKLDAIFVYYVFQWGISCQAEAVDNEEWGPGIHMVNINVHIGKIVSSTVLIQGRSATVIAMALHPLWGPRSLGRIQNFKLVDGIRGVFHVRQRRPETFGREMIDTVNTVTTVRKLSTTCYLSVFVICLFMFYSTDPFGHGLKNSTMGVEVSIREIVKDAKFCLKNYQ